MEKASAPDTSQLFLVRLWADDADPIDLAYGVTQTDSGRGVHGKVQHVLTGKAASFSDWRTLNNLLLEMAHARHETKPQEPDKEGGK